jgi:hypothetical protein
LSGTIVKSALAEKVHDTKPTSPKSMLKAQEKATKNNKDQNPPTPGQATTPSATAVANLAVESE